MHHLTGNHTGYGQFTGPRTDASTIKTLYEGLTQSHLLDFDVLLSGYIPSADALHEVTLIARDLKLKRATMKPGSFFWILDPVMGDQGRLYVSEEMVRGYKKAISGGTTDGPDLIVPNGFELELISNVHLSSDDDDDDDEQDGDNDTNRTNEIGTKLTRQPTGENYEASLHRVKQAISVLHTRDNVRMVIVTSIRLKDHPGNLYVVGSEMTSTGQPRIFTVQVPVLDCYFSGTGDMFAGLMVARLREACSQAGTLNQHGWASNDDIKATELPLAKATVKVLSSMRSVLGKTMKARDEEIERWKSGRRGSVDPKEPRGDEKDEKEQEKEEEKEVFLARTKAAEVRAVRNARDLIEPEIKYEAVEL